MKVRTSLTENNNLYHEKASIKGFLPKGETTKAPIAIPVSSHSEQEGGVSEGSAFRGGDASPCNCNVADGK